MARTYTAGIVTAYGAAKEAGYTGTYEEFCEQQAGFAGNAAQVAEDRAAVETIKNTFETVTVPAAVQTVQTEGATQEAAVTAKGTEQVAAVRSAGDAQTGRVQMAGEEEVQDIETAGTTQVNAVNAAGTTQVGAVNAAGTTQTGNVNDAGATQMAAIEAKGEETRESIPDDYTTLSNDVSDLKSSLSDVDEKLAEGQIYPFAVVDADGKAAIAVDEDGTFIAKAIDVPVLSKLETQEKRDKNGKQANFDAELNMFIAYGQSWSLGYDTSAITLSQRYDSLMFNTGIKNNPLTDVETVPTSFVPMVEATTSSGASQNCGETPVSAMCNIIKQLIEEENGYTYTDFPYQLLGNTPGMGDTTLAELKKGTTWYTRLISQVQAAYNIASALGKRLVVQAFSWQQFQLGTGLTGTYAENLEQLRLDIDTDVKAITGQTQDVKCITWQMFNMSATGAVNCYDKYVGASETYPNIICCGASYQFQHVSSNNLHLTATSNDWAGAYLGLAYKRSIIDGEKFVPLKPTKAEVHGTECVLTFNVPQKPLAFDTDAVATIANKGFTLLTSDGTEKTISRVDIVAPDKIKIKATENISTSDRIAYGQNAGTAFGPVNGNRGNVRDSQGNYIKCTAGDGTVFPVHNWLVVFDKPISSLIGG